MQAQALERIPADLQQFGRYQLLCRFAAGGMANLYLARSYGDPCDKIVAIKRIHDHLAHDPAFRDMLVDEARLSARLCHPNVVQVIELGAVNDQLFIAMEFVEGESLKALIKRVRPPYAQCARIIAEAAAGLHHAHELRDAEGRLLEVVHRDVSPQNILVSYDGEVKIVDFGVAKARGNLQQTGRHVVKGKYAYMAPEQFMSGSVDRRTDVFALGIVLYELTTHRRLFRAPSPPEAYERVRKLEIPRPTQLLDDYPARLEEIVMTALQRDPDQRFQSAGELEDALSELVLESNVRVAPLRRATARSLKAVMRVVFAQRIEHKRRLLAWSDYSGEIGDVTRISGSTRSLGPLEGTVDEADPRRRQAVTLLRRLLWGLVALMGAVTTALLIILATRCSR